RRDRRSSARARLRRSAAQAQTERAQAADGHVVLELRRLAERGVGEAAGERGERQLRLEPPEAGADAVVRAPAEGDVLAVGAREVERVGRGELLGIAVGRAEHEKDALA